VDVLKCYKEGGCKMADKNLDMMKKMIDAKNEKSSQQGGFTRADKKVGESRKGMKKYKKSGLFDK
jgi:hypothetical protein